MHALSAVRVVSIALNVPGPLAVSMLAAEGARVTKVEPPGGDPLEGFCPSYYAELHTGIAVERVDLKAASGRARMGALLADADLFVASQRPAALARLQLDANALLAPGAPTAHVRWLNIVGDVDRPEVPGHDLTYLAEAGLLGSEVPRTLIADVLGAHRAFAAALLLLRRAPGAQAQVGLLDSLHPLTGPLRHRLTGPGELLGGGLPAYGIYEAREGRVAIAALEPHFRARLYARLSLPDGSDLAPVIRTRTAEEWAAWAASEDLPLVVIAKTPRAVRARPPQSR